MFPLAFEKQFPRLSQALTVLVEYAKSARAWLISTQALLLVVPWEINPLGTDSGFSLLLAPIKQQQVKVLACKHAKNTQDPVNVGRKPRLMIYLPSFLNRKG